MCVLIGLQVCFHSALKHENEVRNMVGCLQVVRIYSFKKEIEVYIYTSYIVFLFVKMKNNFIKEIKHVSRVFIAGWKPRQSFWELSNRWKLPTVSRVFTDLLSNSPKGSPWFSPSYEGTENMFYFFNQKHQNVTMLYNIV